MNIADHHPVTGLTTCDYGLTAKLYVENPQLFRKLMEVLKHSGRAEFKLNVNILLSVAERQATLLIPYVEMMLPYLLDSEIKREIILILCRMSATSPNHMVNYAAELGQALESEHDPVLYRHLINVLSRIAVVNPRTAPDTYTLLTQALEYQPLMNTVHILNSLRDFARHLPDKQSEMVSLAQHYLDHEHKAVQQAARRLLKGLKSQHYTSP